MGGQLCGLTAVACCLHATGSIAIEIGAAARRAERFYHSLTRRPPAWWRAGRPQLERDSSRRNWVELKFQFHCESFIWLDR